MRKLTRKPQIASPRSTAPITAGVPRAAAYIRPPTVLPSTMAANVLISSRPLARDSARSGRSSGTMPYLAGLKSADWVPMRKSTTSSPSSLPAARAAMPSSMAQTSSPLVQTSTVRLLRVSASWPA